ncbi:MAG TPA: hypothetical protein VKV18_04815 [Chthonomonas sp.]|uniref:hypothetical protein n=1 Tax=Chthonomonas sp. TaxID=2282153 RepID=UPI002B4AB4CB|nr:hypothetical protein [Chthonomonas sp.]HLI47998.1 hypothetical protein [Chthonomonas sp.]
MRIVFLVIAMIVGFILWKLLLGVIAWVGHLFFIALEIALLVWLISEVYKLLTSKNKELL